MALKSRLRRIEQRTNAIYMAPKWTRREAQGIAFLRQFENEFPIEGYPPPPPMDEKAILQHAIQLAREHKTEAAYLGQNDLTTIEQIFARIESCMGVIPSRDSDPMHEGCSHGN